MFRCRACRSPKLSYHSRVRECWLDNAFWYRCADCGSMTSGLTYADVAHIYDAEYVNHLTDDKHNPNHDAPDHDAIEESFQGHVQRIAMVQPAACPVLDVGCLDGSFLSAAMKRGYEPWGFDVTPSVRAFCSRRLGCDPDRITIAPGSPGFRADLFARRFPIVHCSEVLEHVERPAELLRELRRTCADGGHLFLQTPRVDEPGGPVDERRLWDQTAHLCILSPGALRVMLLATGWDPVERLTHYWPGGQLCLARAAGGA